MRRSKFFYGWWVLIGLFLLMALTVGLIVNSFSFFFKPITDSIGISIGEFSLTTSISAIFAMLGALVVGSLIKKIKLRWILIVSAVIYGVGILIESQCKTLVQFYIISALLGLGYAGLGGVAVSQIVANWFKDKQGLAMGIAMAGSGVGGMIFAPLINALILGYGWQTALIILGIIALVITLPISIFLVKLHPSEKGLRAFGASDETKDTETAKAETGLTLKEAAKTPTFWGLCLTNLIAGLLVMGVQMHVPTYLGTLGLTSSFAAIVMVVSNAVLIPGKLIFGAINDKAGPKFSAVFIFGIYILTLVSLYFAKSQAVSFVFAVLFGFGAAITTVALPLWTVSLVGTKDYAMIFSIMSVFMTIGAAIGTPLTGFIYDAAKSYTNAWTVLIVIAAVGLVITYWSIAKGKKYLNSKLTTLSDK